LAKTWPRNEGYLMQITHQIAGNLWLWATLGLGFWTRSAWPHWGPQRPCPLSICSITQGMIAGLACKKSGGHQARPFYQITCPARSAVNCPKS
jgi:hypothetical protein